MKQHETTGNNRKQQDMIGNHKKQQKMTGQFSTGQDKKGNDRKQKETSDLSGHKRSGQVSHHHQYYNKNIIKTDNLIVINIVEI